MEFFDARCRRSLVAAGGKVGRGDGTRTPHCFHDQCLAAVALATARRRRWVFFVWTCPPPNGFAMEPEPAAVKLLHAFRHSWSNMKVLRSIYRITC